MQTTHCCQGLSSASNTVDLIAAHAVHFGLARSLKTFLPQHRTAIVSRSARKQYQFACTRSQRCRAMVAASERVKIPARQGKALRLSKGQYIKVINTHGSQVVDTWAFKSDDLNEMMSMEHTRSAILSLLPKVCRHLCSSALHSYEQLKPHLQLQFPQRVQGFRVWQVGDVLVTNKRRPILTLVDDTSPGVHDTCMSACDIYRYRGLGCEGYHDSCTDNLYKGKCSMQYSRRMLAIKACNSLCCSCFATRHAMPGWTALRQHLSHSLHGLMWCFTAPSSISAKQRS